MGDPFASTRRALLRGHTPRAVADRLRRGTTPSYLGDAVLGAVDGTVTTFAVVASVAGAGLGAQVALVVGLANVVADGFSMAAGNALRAKADLDSLDAARSAEETHTELVPEGEREEVRQIFAAKGFRGRALDSAVETVTSDRARWVDTMLREELGLRLRLPAPTSTALITFGAFVAVGTIPLLVLLLARTALTPAAAFAATGAATFATFAAVGWVKGTVLGRARLRSSVETLLLGGGAAVIAWGVGRFVGGLWAP